MERKNLEHRIETPILDALGCLTTIASIPLLPFILTGILFKEEIIDRMTGKRQKWERELEESEKIYQIRKDRESIYGCWVDKASKVLEQFIRDEPQKIDGFTFTEYHNTRADPNWDYRTIKLLPNRKFCIEIREPIGERITSTEYGEETQEKKGYNSENIAKILLGYDEICFIRPKRHKYSNLARNAWVREIEKKTGFNIKKEVQKHNS